MYQHDENTEARSQKRALTTLRLSRYSHSHYSDEPNKEMHTILFTLCLSIYSHSQSHFSDEPIKEMHTILFTLPHVTHTVNTRTNQTDT